MASIKLEYINVCSQYMKQVNRMMKRKRVGLIQVGFWTAYWCLELLMFSLAFSGFLISNDSLIEALINLLFGTIFFYMSFLFVLPSKVGHINILKIIWRLTLILLVCMALRRCGILLMAEWVGFKGPVVTNLKFFFVSGLDIFFRFGIYATLVWFFRRQGELQRQMLQKELEEEKLKHELLETKYAVLKAQINPHFLFNTLNFIHSKAISSEDPIIDKTVLLLSDILRHALRGNTSGHSIWVSEELEHIKKLSELNSLRFNGDFYLKIIEEGVGYRKKIPSFILLTCFENAMKYGVFDDPKNPVILCVKQSPHFLEISLKNKIRELESVSNHAQFAIGKRYVKNILEQFHKNNYILEYHDDGQFHTVQLKIYEG